MAREVLIIDDNTAFRTTARSLLARDDGLLVVAEAATGFDGIEQAERHRPDLALVDVQLPDIDGFEVAERLSRLDPAPEVILTSSLDASDFGALVMNSSALGFIAKADLSAAAIEALVARPI
jgi:DNA-binding NarL/FixJ family response regulator